MWFYIPLSIIGISLTVIIVIVVRRLPQLATLRTDILERERIAKVKFRIIEKRLLRKLVNLGKGTGTKLRPLASAVSGFVKQMYDKATALEQQYKEETRIEKLEAQEENPVEKVEAEQRLARLLSDAKAAREGNDMTLAEKKYIEVLSLSPKCAEAYQGLGAIYRAREEWTQAREVFAFLIKLLPAEAVVHATLGEVLAKLGEWEQAAVSYKLACELAPETAGYFFEWGRCLESLGDRAAALDAYRQAVEIEPGNPRFLDFLIEISILSGNKLSAQNAFDALKGVNPENQKLDEFNQRINQMGKRWEPRGDTARKAHLAVDDNTKEL